MDNDYQNLAKQTRVYLLLGVLAISSFASAQLRGRNGVEGTRMSERDSRREQMRQEATASFTEVDNALKAMLEKVAKNQRPDSSEVEQAGQLLEDNKRYALVYDDAQKSTYMLLQAWAGFYREDVELALNWSVRASRADATNSDAWISQALFSLLNGRTPLEPRTQKPRSQRRDNFRDGRRARRPGRMGRPEMTGTEDISSGQPYGQKGILDFDMSTLRNEMLKERFEQSQYQTVSGSSIEYALGQDTLCILFWQSDGVPGDANDVPADNQPKDRGRGVGTMGSGGSQPRQGKFMLEAQQKYMMQMVEACEGNEHIKFIQINTDRYDVAEKAAKIVDPSMKAMPLVIAAESGSGAAKYVGLKAKEPFMMIVDKRGLVKYAGPAADFMPAFILTQTTGVPIDLKEQASSQPTTSSPMVAPKFDENTQMTPQPTRGLKPVRPTTPVLDSHEPVADPNEMVSDPNSVGSKRPVENRKEPADVPELSLEDQIRAEKLLQSAKLHIEESRRLRMKNPRQGIEDARKVLEEFPNTEYAQQARELLRRVPSRWKARHGITDEELGL